MSQLSHLAYDLLTILGPTATGKTQLAVQLANKLGGEIISADSRQVYRGMDIGTGKDLGEYKLNGKSIPYHLIDIVDPIEEYNVAQFQKDFQKVSTDIRKREKLPILSGGTGFYIKAVLMDFQLSKTEPNKQLRQKLENWKLEDLINKLKTISPGASANTLVDTKRRVIRAIEVAKNRRQETGDRDNEIQNPKSKIQNPIVLGVNYPREVIRERITARLHERLNNGMIEEVELLLKNGVTHEKLNSFGLEYRFISHYLQGQLSQDEMAEKLNTAIHQFAKKQMTFFRNIEKYGIKIHWIPEGDFETALGIISKG
ncbi:tRNA (adenosine(37)-N6)-dimethylallyltransferase MiaA [Candidatus Marinimicrobia bacterium PRS2]|nr:tRNA (adenosine(37)-N6)-dimethylallyltransferase MiaA [Candidatus Marinimicrobia bacterium PRS2]